jgi:N-acetylneuraminic acid mutarotase
MKIKYASRSAFLTPRALLSVLLCAVGCSIITGTLLGFLRSEPPRKVSPRTLTFAERVAYQRAIEEVYWRHRIWPKERPDPKPSIDAVMPQTQLEKKVADYLRKSRALEDYWQRPITAEQLQSEMNRMAQHTRQPEVLRELFEVLGEDPFVIAECLARPALAERLIRSWYAYDKRFHGELKRRTEAELQAYPTVEQMKQTSGKYGEIELVKSDGAQDRHIHSTQRGVNLSSREWNDAVKKLAATFTKPRAPKAVDFGVRRDLAAFQCGDMSAHSQKSAAEDYRAIPVGKLSPLQEDEEHFYATAVIEKTQDHLKLARVIWFKEPVASWLGRGENHAPHLVAVPAGNYKLPQIPEGGCIDDSWTPITAPPDVRDSHKAVWTGSEMIVWGGEIFQLSAYDTGARYNPSTDTWTPTSTTNAPTPRALHTAVWTGTEMIVWGGRDENFPNPQTFNTGGRYNPITDSWLPTNITNAPDPRYLHTAVWTGSAMIVWGGTTTFFPSYFNTGGRYDPNTDSWIATSTADAPDARYSHTAVWTGGEMVIWGGTDDTTVFNTGARYDPATNAWSATNIANAPTARNNHTAIWTGSEMIVWGGVNNGTLFNTGGKYNPGTDSWTAPSTSNAPSARESHTAIWSDNEMIVWGGSDAGGFSNNGGRYNPDTNTWTTITTTNAPSARQAHTAIWTGSEMIIWGGYPDTDTGGRYNPDTDSWIATSTGGDAPLGRYRHTAVWTGVEMIIWGGARYVSWLNTGGRYNPSTDSWTATSIPKRPQADTITPQSGRAMK